MLKTSASGHLSNHNATNETINNKLMPLTVCKHVELLAAGDGTHGSQLRSMSYGPQFCCLYLSTLDTARRPCGADDEARRADLACFSSLCVSVASAARGGAAVGTLCCAGSRLEVSALAGGCSGWLLGGELVARSRHCNTDSLQLTSWSRHRFIGLPACHICRGWLNGRLFHTKCKGVPLKWSPNMAQNFCEYCCSMTYQWRRPSGRTSWGRSHRCTCSRWRHSWRRCMCSGRSLARAAASHQ